MTATPLVTVVVPTRNNERTLHRCLTAIRAQTLEAVEVIVVDNHSDDATRTVAADLCDRLDLLGPERSAQRNRGWRVGRGEFVLFVDSDMVLDPDVVTDVVDRFRRDPRLGGLVVPELAFGHGYLAHCRALEKVINLSDPRAQAARAFPRRVLEELGGFDEHLSGFEDWELTDRVLRAGYRVGSTRALVWHDEGRLRLGRAFAKKRYYGRWLPAYLDRRGADPARRLARPRLLRAVPANPVLAPGLFVLKAVELTGVLIGAVEAWWAKRR